MKLEESLNGYIAEFEQVTGRLVSDELRPLLKALAIAGDRFYALGVEDAAAGRAQRVKEAFVEWGKRELSDAVDKDRPIVELIYTCYINGYNK